MHHASREHIRPAAITVVLGAALMPVIAWGLVTWPNQIAYTHILTYSSNPCLLYYGTQSGVRESQSQGLGSIAALFRG